MCAEDMSGVHATPRLNPESPLWSRLRDALTDAQEFDVAVAYAKTSGVQLLQRLSLPEQRRFVVGTGFALTEPAAVERLAAGGAAVRVVIGSAEVMPSAFHPKLYLVTGPRGITVLAGSGNLTRGGLETN